jgi:hypothetical protein
MFSVKLRRIASIGAANTRPRFHYPEERNPRATIMIHTTMTNEAAAPAVILAFSLVV